MTKFVEISKRSFLAGVFSLPFVKKAEILSNSVETLIQAPHIPSFVIEKIEIKAPTRKLRHKYTVEEPQILTCFVDPSALEALNKRIS